MFGLGIRIKDEKIGQGRENTKQFLKITQKYSRNRVKNRSNSNTVEELMIDPPPPSEETTEKSVKIILKLN